MEEFINNRKVSAIPTQIKHKIHAGYAHGQYMVIFLSGGCKNGKSSHAERIAKKLSGKNPPLYYIATMEPHDDEDLARIARHRESRAGMGFETLEIGRDMDKLWDLRGGKGSYLLDSLTALLANEMFLPGERVNLQAGEKIAANMETLFAKNMDLVLVSDYIYGDAEQYDPLTEKYRKALAHIDRTCAKHADIVLEVIGGTMIPHKGGSLLEAL